MDLQEKKRIEKKMKTNKVQIQRVILFVKSLKRKKTVKQEFEFTKKCRNRIITGYKQNKKSFFFFSFFFDVVLLLFLNE